MQNQFIYYLDRFLRTNLFKYFCKIFQHSFDKFIEWNKRGKGEKATSGEIMRC